MQQLTFEIIGIACFIYLLIYKVLFPLSDKFKIELQKPFSCPLCLTWWMGLMYFCTAYGFKGIIYASIAAVLSGIIERRA